jgi:hypothetical protein
MATNALEVSYLAPWPKGLTPACREHENPELWFPYTAEDRDEAIDVCMGCPILQQCRAIALDRKESGVWGGMLLDRGKPSGLPSEKHPEKLRKQRLAEAQAS